MKTSRNGERPVLCRVLVEARAKAGLSQRQLARRLGRAHSYVAKIEGGERRLEVAEFLQLASALGLDPKTLIAQLQSGEIAAPAGSDPGSSPATTLKPGD